MYRFSHALNVGQALFNSTDYKYILLIGSEQMSKILDYTDRSTCVLLEMVQVQFL
ncbi:MAG: hypothetical protein ACLS9K_00625 [Lachnospira eligens]